MDIVFDFDGVLCEYEGWRGHDKIGKPIPEMIKLVEKLGIEHKLKLSTTRLNPYPFGDYDSPDDMVVSGEVAQIIKLWLSEQNILLYFDEITGYKPFGDIYIDDRGFYFDREYYKMKDVEGSVALLLNDLEDRGVELREQSKEVRSDGK